MMPKNDATSRSSYHEAAAADADGGGGAGEGGGGQGREHGDLLLFFSLNAAAWTAGSLGFGANCGVSSSHMLAKLVPRLNG